jgi:probable phosphoglycerate mutase
VEGLDEPRLMELAGATALGNCSVSSWRSDGERLRPERFNAVEHLHREGTPATRQEDVSADV